MPLASFYQDVCESDEFAKEVWLFRQEWEEAYWEASEDIVSLFEYPRLEDLIAGPVQRKMLRHVPSITYLINSLWGQIADKIDSAVPIMAQPIIDYHVPRALKNRRWDQDFMTAQMLKERVCNKQHGVRWGLHDYCKTARFYMVDLGSP